MPDYRRNHVLAGCYFFTVNLRDRRASLLVEKIALLRECIRTPVMIARGERGVWQRRYWEHTIRDEDDYAAHMDYVHFNPVKHGLVSSKVADWPHSTFRQAVTKGFYPAQWAAEDGVMEGEFGE